MKKAIKRKDSKKKVELGAGDRQTHGVFIAGEDKCLQIA